MPAPFLCPSCVKTMPEIRDGAGVTLNYCQPCHVVGFDAGEIDSYLGRPIEREDLAGKECSTSCPSCSNQLKTWTPIGIEGSEVVLHCQVCRTHWLPASMLRALRGQGAAPLPAPRKTLLPVVRAASSGEASLGASYGTVPLVLLISLFIARTNTGSLVVWFASIIPHELGHALHAWLCDVVAIPTPFGVTFGMQERSSLAGFIMLTITVAIGIIGKRSRSRAMVIGAAGLLTAQIYFTCFATFHRCQEAIVYGGCAGEILLSGAAITAFHLDLPRRMRWDFFRYPALAWSALVFTGNLLRWTRARQNAALIPFGSAVGGDGDMERLVRDFGWTTKTITHTYTNLCYLVLGFIALGYFAGLFMALKKRSNVV